MKAIILRVKLSHGLANHYIIVETAITNVAILRESMAFLYQFCKDLWHIMKGSGHGAMGKVWVFQSRGPVFDSRRTAVVSGRASDVKCSCVTLVYKSVDPH